MAVNINGTGSITGLSSISSPGISGVPVGSASAPAFSFTGDTNTGIYSPGADQVAVATNGTGRLFVDASGFISLGTSTPSTAKFTFNSAGTNEVARFESTDSGAFITFKDSTSTSVNWIEGGADQFSFGTNNSEKLRITSAGLVGIGTSSFPSSGKLQVAGGSATTSIGGVGCISLLDGDANNEFNVLKFDTSVGGPIAAIGAKATTTGAYPSSVGELHFAVQNGASTNTALVIDSSGRVGIGTTTVNQKLHLYDTSNNVYLRAAVGASTGVDYGAAVGGNGIINVRDNAALQIFTNGTERARIDSSGRLLVGTSSARTKYANILQTETISGGSSYGFTTVHNANNAFGSSIALGKSRGTTAGSNTIVASGDSLGSIQFVGADGTDLESAASIEAFVDGTPGTNDMPGRLVFSTTADGASSPTERMRISNGGNSNTFASAGNSGFASRLGEGAGTVYTGLRVLHSATSTLNGTESFKVFSNGNVQNTNNSYGAISDLKLKENIVDANSQWDDLKTLQVRNYNFKEGQTHTQIGLIAQEVELVSPGLVSESPDRDTDGNDLGTVTKSVNYSVLYMKAVKALQEAMERIETLEARLTAAGIE